MEKRRTKEALTDNVIYFLKWTMVSAVMGTICGLVGTAFGYGVAYSQHFFKSHGFMLYLMPVSGVLIVLVHKLLHQLGNKGTNLILESISGAEKIRLTTVPVIFISTILSHLTGASAAKEGAALQIGGCICIFFVASALLKKIGFYSALEAICCAIAMPAGLASALTQGLLELTGGCAAIAALNLPFQLTIALCAFLVSFGGICVFLQTRLFINGNVLRYFCVKTLHGILAAGIAYLCAPIALPKEQPAIAQRGSDYLVNALTGGSIFFASCIAVFGIYLMALVTSALVGKRRN